MGQRAVLFVGFRLRIVFYYWEHLVKDLICMVGLKGIYSEDFS
jgi:hypothetical protein